MFFAMIGFNGNSMYAQKNIVKHAVFGGPIFTHYQEYQEKNRSEGLDITFES